MGLKLYGVAKDGWDGASGEVNDTVDKLLLTFLLLSRT